MRALQRLLGAGAMRHLALQLFVGGRQLVGPPSDAPLQLHLVDRVVHGALEACGRDGRLQQVILRAVLHGLDRDALISLPGQDDDGHAHTVDRTAEFGQERNAVEIGEPVVEQEAVGRRESALLMALGACPRLAELPGVRLIGSQVPLVHHAVFGAVVHDQHAAGRRRHDQDSRGRMTTSNQ